MTEQTRNNIINQVIFLAKATQGDENRLGVAQEIVDRLFISNCFSTEEMTNLIINELTFILNLSKQDIETLLKKYEATKSMVDDKLKIAQLRQKLFKIKVEDNVLNELSRKIEIEEISKNLIDGKFISNQKLLFNFIMQDLCVHFKLSYDEKKEIAKEVKEWMHEK